MPIKLNIDSVIFDLGSTLLEYETIPWDEMFETCTRAGYSYLLKGGHKLPVYDEFRMRQSEIRSKYREKAKVDLEEWSLVDGLGAFLESIGINAGDGMAEKYFGVFYEPISKQLTLFADTPSVLARLKQAGKKIGLVSNTIFPEKYHLKEMEDFQISQYFDFKIFSVTHGFRKPHRSIYQKAIEMIGIEPKKLLFVGDRYLEDIKGPKENGMHAFLKFRTGRDYPDPLPDDLIVIKSLTEIFNYISC